MANSTEADVEKKLMILDCDTGVDDAHAILMAVSNPSTQLIAITCVQGNVGVDQVCYNTARALDACKKDGVSISSLMLIRPYPPPHAPWCYPDGVI